MKDKLISTLLTASMLIGGNAFASDANGECNLDILFNEEDFSITINAENLGTSGIITTISLTDSPEEISMDNLPVYSYVYKTDSSGNLSEKILLPYSLGSGRCYVWLEPLQI